MIQNTEELRKCLDVIHTNLPLLNRNEFSKSITSIVVYLANKELKEAPKPLGPIPSHFATLEKICEDWHWAATTILDQIEKLNKINDPSLVRIDPKGKRMKRWQFDTEKLFEVLEKQAVSNRTRLHAQRCLGMIRTIRDVEENKKKIKAWDS